VGCRAAAADDDDGTRCSFQTVITNTHLRKSTDSERPRYAQKECGNGARKMGTDPLCRTENTRISFILVQIIMSRLLPGIRTGEGIVFGRKTGLIQKRMKANIFNMS
jgi:hypothetical protein